MSGPVMQSGYVGRFAPSPTGALHAGSLVAALASHLDARAHGGRWLLRIEDVDGPRTVPGADRDIIETLARLGMQPDGPVLWQSERTARYEQAFEFLRERGWVYPCACTRREIADSQTQGPNRARSGEAIYPGTCRDGLAAGRPPRAWRVRVGDRRIEWTDRNGRHHDDHLASSVGDFVLRRADGVWAYQLAVVVDDAEQEVTDIVRGDDLTESTARQILLQERLGARRPRYLHLPVLLAEDGRKLSKQNGARPIAGDPPIQVLNAGLQHLGLGHVTAHTPREFWPRAIERWRNSHWMRTPERSAGH